MKYQITEERAWRKKNVCHAQLTLETKAGDEIMIRAFTSGDAICFQTLIPGDEKTMPDSETEKESEHSGFPEADGTVSESYTLFSKTEDSEYADYFYIVQRMLLELQGKIRRTRFEVVQRRTRMTDNVYDKIPEAEIEIRYPEGESLYLFAYHTSAFEEFAASRISWLDQEEGGEKVDRKQHITESYDSLADSLQSDHAALYLELSRMLDTIEEFEEEAAPEEFFTRADLEMYD